MYRFIVTYYVHFSSNVVIKLEKSINVLRLDDSKLDCNILFFLYSFYANRLVKMSYNMF